MVNNVVVFQGVEVTLPPEASFSHRDGVLEVDMSHGFNGKLLLKQASTHQVAASHIDSLRPLLPARAAALEDEDALLQDSLDGQGHQLPAGPAALPTTGRAFWFNASPKATQDLPSLSAAVGSRQERLLLGPPAAGQEERGDDAAPPEAAPCSPHQEEQQEAVEQTVPVQVVPASGMSDTEEAAPACKAAHAPEEHEGGHTAKGVPTPEAAGVPDNATPSPMVHASGKENECMETPAAVKVKGSKEKRAIAGSAPGSKSAKRQRGSMSPSKDFSFRWKHVEAAKPGSGATTEDIAPAARWGASLTALTASKARGCLYGGSGREGPRGDAWLFDAERTAWEPAAQSDFGGFDGAAKAWHAATMLDTIEGQQLVVFGGERSDPAPADRAGAAPELAAEEEPEEEEPEEEPVEPIADVCALDAVAHFWVSLPMDGMDGCKQVPARAGPSLTALPDGRGLVFGGLDAEGKYRNDAFVLDARRLSWFSLAGIMKGAPPKPRAYHTATLVGQRIIVVGGMGSKVWSCKEVYSLQLNSWKWTEHTPEVDGDVPSPRSGHSAVALPDGRHLLLFGGGDLGRDLFHSGCVLLDTRTWRWRTPKIQGVARPSGRAGHAVAMLRVPGNKDVLLVHGGRTKDHKLCRDTWLLELS